MSFKQVLSKAKLEEYMRYEEQKEVNDMVEIIRQVITP